MKISAVTQWMNADYKLHHCNSVAAVLLFCYSGISLLWEKIKSLWFRHSACSEDSPKYILNENDSSPWVSSAERPRSRTQRWSPSIKPKWLSRMHTMTCFCRGFFLFFCLWYCSLASFCAEWKPLRGACKDRERLERRGWDAGRMTHLAASDGLFFVGGRVLEAQRPHHHFPPLASVCSVATFAHRPLFVPSGVDGDDFAATTSDQQDALQPFCQNLEELHIWWEC